jgi:hypothetical protein
MKFRKKPVIIEAWTVISIIHYAEKYWNELPQCIKDAYNKGEFVFVPEGIHVKTLEGIHIAGREDMLIRGVNGEFYGCKMNIFEKTYEKVED